MKLWRYGLALERLGDRYRLDGSLGSGGMADVCLAWDEREQREVAIKVIKSNELDQRSLNRFLKEASQVARWRHPNILRIYGDARLELVDTAQGSIVPYIVMEYAAHGDLQHRLRPGQPFLFAETMNLFQQLCAAVAYAHAQGIIHRDLKPHNILFCGLPDGSEQVVLSDFGLAVEISATHFTFAAGGTLPYMAPEQLLGHAQMASDIFALGVILYQLCTGRLPFNRTLQDLRKRGTPLPPPLPSSLYRILPTELDDVILTALAEDPAQRYPDALAFWDAVHAVIDAATIAYISRYESRRNSLSAHSAAHLSKGQYDRRSDAKPVQLSGSARRLAAQRRARASRARNVLAQANVSLEDLAVRQSSQHQDLSRHSVVVPRSQVDDDVSSAALDRVQTNSRVSAHTLSRAPSPSSLSSRSVDRSFPGVCRRGHGFDIVQHRRGVRVISVLVLLFVSGSLFYFGGLLPGHAGFLSSLRPGGGAAQATVTLTLASKVVSNDYTFKTLTDQPSNPSQQQIAIHSVSAQSQAQPQTVQGTGHTHVSGTAAKGILTFLNGAFVTQSVPMGTVVMIGRIQVVSDANANIPPANIDNGSTGRFDVPAHVINTGINGNIAALAINKPCCSTNNTIFVENTAPFTGGQDPKDYTFVQQSDVNAVANAGKTGLEQQARTVLNGQVPAGQQLLAISVQCTATTATSQPVGDNGQNVVATQVTVTSRCHGTSYDQKALQQSVKAQMLAGQTVGSAYALADPIQLAVTLPTTQTNGQTVLRVHAVGTWVYRLSAAQQRVLAQKIAGHSVAQAKTILDAQIGIQNAFFAIGNANNGRLPADSNQIAIQVQIPVAAKILFRKPESVALRLSDK